MPTELQQLPGDACRMVRGRDDFAEAGQRLRLQRAILQQRNAKTQNHLQHVVDFMGHAASQRPHRFKTLGRLQLCRELAGERLGREPFRDIANHEMDQGQSVLEKTLRPDFHLHGVAVEPMQRVSHRRRGRRTVRVAHQRPRDGLEVRRTDEPVHGLPNELIHATRAH